MQNCAIPVCLSITFELVADMVVLPDRSVCQVNQEEAL